MSLAQTHVAATTRLGRLDGRSLRALHLIALGHSDHSIAARLGLDHAGAVRLSRDIFHTLELTPTATVDRQLLAILTLRQAWGDR